MIDTKKTVKILVCRVGELAEEIEMDNSLEGIEEIVGGSFDEFYPFREDIALVCNRYGMDEGLQPNRKVVDCFGDEQIIYGDFFFVNAPVQDEYYSDIPARSSRLIKKRVLFPQRFEEINGKIIAESYNPQDGKAMKS